MALAIALNPIRVIIINLIHHPSVVLITGKRRSGKSCLAYYILEKINEEQKIPCFVVSLPKEKHHLLPSFITPVDTVDALPENCIALIDESSLSYHAYKWGAKETVVMDRMISVSGQKKQTFIFISHTMRKFAVTLLLETDLLLCKEPSLFHSKLERSEVRKLTEEASKEFKKLPKDDVKKNVYVISEDFVGFIHNPMPSFFTPELSAAYAGININEKEEETEQVEIKQYPSRLELKIWFKPEDKDKILDVILWDGKERLSEIAVICTADKCHVDFDVKHVGNGKYTLVSKHYNLEENLRELRRKKVSFYLDTETSIVDGEFYSISEEQLVFKIEKKQKEQKEDRLAEYANGLNL